MMGIAVWTMDESDSFSMLNLVGNSRYKSVWIPIAQQLDLGWIALMKTGFDVDRENVDAVRQEMNILREYFRLHDQASECDELKRLEFSIRQIEKLVSQGRSVSIG